jgi:hypothetical protein
MKWTENWAICNGMIEELKRVNIEIEQSKRELQYLDQLAN